MQHYVVEKPLIDCTARALKNRWLVDVLLVFFD
jgi:hypothetical protein